VAVQPSSGTTVAISGVDLTLAMPPGVSVAIKGGTTSEIQATSLTAGSAAPGNAVVAGSYLAGPQQVRLGLVDAPSAAWHGEALLLTFTVAASPVVLRGDFQKLNAPPPAITVVGVDSAANSSVLLSDQVTTTLTVVPAT
jgi:hypothetical protein